MRPPPRPVAGDWCRHRCAGGCGCGQCRVAGVQARGCAASGNPDVPAVGVSDAVCVRLRRCSRRRLRPARRERQRPRCGGPRSSPTGGRRCRSVRGRAPGRRATRARYPLDARCPLKVPARLPALVQVTPQHSGSHRPGAPSPSRPRLHVRCPFCRCQRGWPLVPAQVLRRGCVSGAGSASGSASRSGRKIRPPRVPPGPVGFRYVSGAGTGSAPGATAAATYSGLTTAGAAGSAVSGTVNDCSRTTPSVSGSTGPAWVSPATARRYHSGSVEAPLRPGGDVPPVQFHRAAGQLYGQVHVTAEEDPERVTGSPRCQTTESAPGKRRSCW